MLHSGLFFHKYIQKTRFYAYKKTRNTVVKLYTGQILVTNNLMVDSA